MSNNMNHEVSCTAPLHADVFGTCAFSMSQNINLSQSGRLVTGDSIVVAVVDLGGTPQSSGITKVSFCYQVVSGPHKGKWVALPSGSSWTQSVSDSGLCVATQVFDPPLDSLTSIFFDFDDEYFRGGDVLRYFWYAMNVQLASVSYPHGVQTDPGRLSLERAELLTGGLLEVNFLPIIEWDSTYVSRVASHPTGKVSPTADEIAASSPASCILYVNRVNTARRSGSINRTAFMYTLDRLGYRGSYDVYDVQGYGNTDNDLAGRATVHQASAYALVVHDVGRSAAGTIPDGTDSTISRVDQEQWYRNYLNQGLTGERATASLWIIGENWAFESSTTQLVKNYMGLGAVADDQDLGSDPELEGVGSFTFWDGVVQGFAGADKFYLQSSCPSLRAFDGLTAAAGTTTHRYRKASTSGPGAVVMNKSAALHWNAIAMGFNWFDARLGSSAPPSPMPWESLAQKILIGVLPTGCERSPGSTEAQRDEASVLPAVTALHQSFPNPFNPMTTISFDLAEDCHVSLCVYDISGRLVKTLVRGRKPPQRHAVRWLGTDDHDRRVASGVYLCRLETPSFSATRKLLVVR